ncbi:hypothetical protein DPEC_G00226450 [Dallia pectoralis]|uniref:Uncharacterized protein n=1 Tax=Dallia pectoralis TaxID=75939 RepID=A0ACC2G0Q7_DALPE|nr:hypothetical protein DPEC_G00226450 [Dallia pectoralis]
MDICALSFLLTERETADGPNIAKYLPRHCFDLRNQDLIYRYPHHCIHPGLEFRAKRHRFGIRQLHPAENERISKNLHSNASIGLFDLSIPGQLANHLLGSFLRDPSEGSSLRLLIGPSAPRICGCYPPVADTIFPQTLVKGDPGWVDTVTEAYNDRVAAP